MSSVSEKHHCSIIRVFLFLFLSGVAVIGTTTRLSIWHLQLLNRILLYCPVIWSLIIVQTLLREHPFVITGGSQTERLVIVLREESLIVVEGAMIVFYTVSLYLGEDLRLATQL